MWLYSKLHTNISATFCHTYVSVIQPLTKYFGVRKNLGVAICIDDCKMATAHWQGSAYREQWRVTIPDFKKLLPVPNSPGLVPPSTGGGDSQSSHCEPKDSKILPYRLLACDQRSFLTGSHRVDMQAAYIINTVRKDNRRKAKVVSATDSSYAHSNMLTIVRKSFLPNSAFIIHPSGILNWIASLIVFFAWLLNFPLFHALGFAKPYAHESLVDI